MFHRVETVDCTADPHEVEFETVEEMLDTILRVCESDLVKAVRSVRLVYGEGEDCEEFESDFYTDPITNKNIASGAMAEKHKVAGLAFYSDAEVDKRHHLPPGLTGVKHAIRIARERLPRRCFKIFEVGVVWAFAGEASCSDYITATPESMTVDFSNQDWWVGLAGYKEHIERLSEIVGVNIEPTG
jgi:hypothetical protein